MVVIGLIGWLFIGLLVIGIYWIFYWFLFLLFLFYGYGDGKRLRNYQGWVVDRVHTGYVSEKSQQD